ncbi:MAG: ATP-binding cassette domain-containing protein [archaeon]
MNKKKNNEKIAVNVQSVSKHFKDKNVKGLKSLVTKQKFYAVKNVSFKVKEGEIFGILGPNGSGKSTLIRMLSTLLLPDKGKITVFGLDIVKDAFEVKKLINRVSVEASFFKALSVKSNLFYGARLYGLSDKEAIERSEKIFRKLGFKKEKINEEVGDLSRGMQQKVAITRGFLSNPKLLLLDEPTTGLDPVSKKQVQEFIKKVMKELKLTIILCTHDMNEAQELCDRIAVMDESKVVALGTLKELRALVSTRKVYSIHLNNALKALKELKKIKELKDLRMQEGRKNILFECSNLDSTLPKIFSVLNKNNLRLVHLNQAVPSLEDVFFNLTGKSLVAEND